MKVLKHRRLSITALWAMAFCCLVTQAMASAATLVYLGKRGDPFTVHNVHRLVRDPRQAFFVHYRGNPVISGPNLYAPNPVTAGSAWNVYFGGWRAAGQQHDEIYLSTTRDDTLTHGFSGVRTVIGHGVYRAVNDPSAVRRNNRWFMAMTTAVAGGNDHCSVMTSPDGVHWPQPINRTHEIIFRGAHVSLCGRPSLIWNSRYQGTSRTGRWELYFDGIANGRRQQHLAVSTEAVPRHFSYVRPVGRFVDADVRLLPTGQYIAAYRRLGGPKDWRINYATSQDGIHFTDHGQLLAPDPLAGYDDCGVTNPGWAINEKGVITSLMYGGTNSCHYTTHKLGVALPQAAVTLFSGTVAHTHRQAVNASTQRIDTHQYKNVDKITITDHSGAPPIINQTIHGTTGDAWGVIYPHRPAKGIH
ncbi:hypothetical protein [Streptomyces sp. L2]|uniref:hypothetical protein n=1 Tax=Streptomyces sp. L2 TaxID=2162665 RepID=UPI00101316B8|nr:hypothetical protein [Streptomyces sp. L2]